MAGAGGKWDGLFRKLIQDQVVMFLVCSVSHNGEIIAELYAYYTLTHAPLFTDLWHKHLQDHQMQLAQLCIDLYSVASERIEISIIAA